MAFLFPCCYHTRMRTFPTLRRSERSREFNLYNDEQRSCVVYNWLFFRKKGFRDLDTICLGLDGINSHGWQSMGIAHYLGLDERHHGFFEGATLSYALSVLLPLSFSDPGYGLIYCYLRDWGTSYKIDETIEEMYVQEDNPLYHTERNEAAYWVIEELVSGSGEAGIDEHILRLSTADSTKRRVRLNNRTVYYSQASLREAVKCLYDYRCQICSTRIYSPGWITTLPRKQQWRYLNADAHHIKPLSQDGPDTMDNLLCLCPTCHRRFHTKEFILLQDGSRIGCEDVVLDKQWEVTTKHLISLY